MKKLIVTLAAATLAFTNVAFAEDAPATADTAKTAMTQETTVTTTKTTTKHHHHHKKHHCKKDCHCGE
ncbi:MAG: hypothetical protein ACYCQI_16535 [Gammaproteobacteria bacterium]